MGHAIDPRHLLAELRGAAIRLHLAATGGAPLATPASALTDTQREAIRATKAELLSLLADDDSEAQPADWRVLDAAYQAHHWQCPHCIAGGLRRGQRCAVGLVLWQRYADCPWPTRG